MASAFRNRLNKLSDAVQPPDDNITMLINYDGKMAADKIKAGGLVFIINLSNEKTENGIDDEIEKEIEALKRLGLSETEIGAACETAAAPTTDRNSAGKKVAANRTGTGKQRAG